MNATSIQNLYTKLAIPLVPPGMGRPRKKNQFKRMKDSQYLYAAYYDDRGERRWKSTGTSDELEANVVVSKWLTADGSVRPLLDESIIRGERTFDLLTADFFLGENCPFLQRQRLFNRYRKDTSVQTDLNNLTLWILPYWKSKTFSDVSTKTVEEYLHWLITTPSSSTKKPLSSTAVHNTLGCFRKILLTLFEIQRVPYDKHLLVPSYSRRTSGRRTPLEFVEVKQLLFPLLQPRLHKAEATNELISFWDRNAEIHAMLLLCYFSGLRIAEVQGLRVDCIKRTVTKGGEFYFANIVQTWAESIQVMKPESKTNDKRWVLCWPPWSRPLLLLFKL